MESLAKRGPDPAVSGADLRARPFRARRRMTFVLVLALLGTLALWPAPRLGAAVRGGEIFVALGAPRGGDGTAGAPLAAVQDALDLAGPGAVIRIGPGVYTGKLHSVRHGTPTAPIRLIGDPRGVRLRSDGTSRLFEISHHHLWLEGLELSDANILLTIIGGRGNRVLGTFLHDAGSECVRLRAGAASNEIAYSNIDRCGLTGFAGSKRNGEGIYVGTAPERLGDNPTPGPDRSNANHIHHNNLNAPSECVDIKEDADDNVVEANRCRGGRYPDGAGLVSRGRGTAFVANDSSGHLGSGIMLTGDRVGDGTATTVIGNVLAGNARYGLKVVAGTQRRMCGNDLTANGIAPATPLGSGAAQPC